MRIPIELSGAGEVKVLRACAVHPIVLKLPESVVEIVQQETEWVGEIQNPADELAQKYQAWEDGTSADVQACGKGIATCFENSCGVPLLLFWILEHFSDADFPLTESQKRDLVFHAFDEAACVRSCHVTTVMSTDSTDSLEYCWYFLVRLLEIDAELAARNLTPHVQRHSRLIRCHYSLLLGDLKHFHELGWITTASPREDIERRLIDMATCQPSLKAIVARLIRDWDALEEGAAGLQQLARARSHRLEGVGGLDDPADHVEDADDIQRSVKKQERVMSQIRCLERVMSPDSDDDLAWHHPLDYIELRNRHGDLRCLGQRRHSNGDNRARLSLGRRARVLPRSGNGPPCNQATTI